MYTLGALPYGSATTTAPVVTVARRTVTAVPTPARFTVTAPTVAPAVPRVGVIPTTAPAIFQRLYQDVQAKRAQIQAATQPATASKAVQAVYGESLAQRGAAAAAASSPIPVPEGAGGVVEQLPATLEPEPMPQEALVDALEPTASKPSASPSAAEVAPATQAAGFGGVGTLILVGLGVLLLAGGRR